MRKVKFVESLNVKEMIVASPHDGINYMSTPDVAPCYVGNGEVMLDVPVETKVAPIHHICQVDQGEHRDVFIAYSDEVADLLGLPLKELTEEKERLEQLADSFLVTNRKLEHQNEGYEARFELLEKATFSQRLMYALTGKLIYLC